MANEILEFFLEFLSTKLELNDFHPNLLRPQNELCVHLLVLFQFHCCCVLFLGRKTRPVQTGSEVVGQAQPAGTKRVRAGGARASRGGPEPVGAAQKRVLTGGAGGASPGTHTEEPCADRMDARQSQMAVAKAGRGHFVCCAPSSHPPPSHQQSASCSRFPGKFSGFFQEELAQLHGLSAQCFALVWQLFPSHFLLNLAQAFAS